MKTLANRFETQDPEIQKIDDYFEGWQEVGNSGEFSSFIRALNSSESGGQNGFREILFAPLGRTASPQTVIITTRSFNSTEEFKKRTYDLTHSIHYPNRHVITLELSGIEVNIDISSVN